MGPAEERRWADLLALLKAGDFKKPKRHGETNHLAIRGLLKSGVDAPAKKRRFYLYAAEAAIKTSMKSKEARWSFLQQRGFAGEDGGVKYVGTKAVRFAMKHRSQRLFVRYLELLRDGAMQARVGHFVPREAPIKADEVLEAKSKTSRIILVEQAKKIFAHRLVGGGRQGWETSQKIKQSDVKKTTISAPEVLPQRPAPIAMESTSRLEEAINTSGKEKRYRPVPAGLRRPGSVGMTTMLKIIDALPREIWAADAWLWTHELPDGFKKKVFEDTFYELKKFDPRAVELYKRGITPEDLELRLLDGALALDWNYWQGVALFDDPIPPLLKYFWNSGPHSSSLIRTLLIRGGVEQNPGPPQSASSRTVLSLLDPATRLKAAGHHARLMEGCAPDVEAEAKHFAKQTDEQLTASVKELCEQITILFNDPNSNGHQENEVIMMIAGAYHEAEKRDPSRADSRPPPKIGRAPQDRALVIPKPRSQHGAKNRNPAGNAEREPRANKRDKKPRPPNKRKPAAKIEPENRIVQPNSQANMIDQAALVVKAEADLERAVAEDVAREKEEERADAVEAPSGDTLPVTTDFDALSVLTTPEVVVDEDIPHVPSYSNASCGEDYSSALEGDVYAMFSIPGSRISWTETKTGVLRKCDLVPSLKDTDAVRLLDISRTSCCSALMGDCGRFFTEVFSRMSSFSLPTIQPRPVHWSYQLLPDDEEMVELTKEMATQTEPLPHGSVTLAEWWAWRKQNITRPLQLTSHHEVRFGDIRHVTMTDDVRPHTHRSIPLQSQAELQAFEVSTWLPVTGLAAFFCPCCGPTLEETRYQSDYSRSVTLGNLVMTQGMSNSARICAETQSAVRMRGDATVNLPPEAQNRRILDRHIARAAMASRLETHADDLNEGPM